LNRQAKKKADRFFDAVAGAASSLLLLDYDGTLAGFRLDRFKARPWAGVSELLGRIQRQGTTRIAIITGRPTAEIPPLLGLDPPPEVWGLHGAERLFPDGRLVLDRPPARTRARLNGLRRRLKRDALGGLFEDKPNAAVMHWRGRSAVQAKAIEARTRALFEPLAKLDGLGLLRFESGLELRSGRDKGGAVAALVAESGRDVPVTYLGDDITDESAFAAVNAATGPHLSVLMRRQSRLSEAEVWLRPPAELRWFLKRWLEAREMARPLGR
jgi:trehalose 6-phosphate phosphatase